MKLFVIISLFFLCGCSLEPPYQRAPVCVPTKWKECECPEKKVVCGPHWWSAFNDCKLNALIERAVKNNQNIFVALQKVVEARALAGIKDAEQYPQFTLTPGYNNSAQLYKLLFPVSLPIEYFRVHQTWYQLPLNVNWEIDLWGKLFNQYKSALLTAQAQEEALCDVLLTVTTEVASSYYKLRLFDCQIQILKETLEINRKELELISKRYKKGLSPVMDEAQSKLTFANVEATYFDTVRQRKIEENKIAILLGIPASCFCIEPKPCLDEPPCIPAGIPSTVLCRRADIREQERLMQAQHAMIGVAYASFFPSLSLTGTIGFLSPDIGQFLSWNSRYWYYGANIGQTVFDWGKNSSNLDATWARFCQASGTYRQTVLAALQEVEDALNNLDMERKQAASLEAALQAASQIATSTRSRYQKGLSNYLELSIAEKNELAAKTNVVQIQGLRFLATIQLIKALGGCY